MYRIDSRRSAQRVPDKNALIDWCTHPAAPIALPVATVYGLVRVVPTAAGAAARARTFLLSLCQCQSRTEVLGLPRLL